MAKDTLLSIAEKCGCSVSTVSRVISGKARKYRISDSTVARVKAEVDRAGFVPSALAQGLRTGKTGIIGLLIPGVDDIFFATMASHIIRNARSLGYTVITIDTQEDAANEKSGIDALVARNVDGAIIIPCSTDITLFERLKKNGIPFVLVDRLVEGSEHCSFISTDNYAGSVMATKHLIDKGHKKILCLQGAPEAYTCKERVRGYSDSMRSSGLEGNIKILGSEFSAENAYEAMKEDLSGEDHCSAVFTMSHRILQGCLMAIRESGLRVPEDISIVTFDDNSMLDFFRPSITCIKQPIGDIASCAVRSIASEISDEKKSSHIFLNPTMVSRSSVKTFKK